MEEDTECQVYFLWRKKDDSTQEAVNEQDVQLESGDWEKKIKNISCFTIYKLFFIVKIKMWHRDVLN